MESQVTLTRATLDELDWLLDRVAEYHRYDHLPYDREVIRPLLKAVISDRRLGALFLVQSGGRSAGYLLLGFGFSIEFGGRDAFIDEFYIEESFRGRGLGRLALELAKAEAEREGIRALHLEVTRGNERARRLYEKSGFSDHDRFLMTFDGVVSE